VRYLDEQGLTRRPMKVNELLFAIRPLCAGLAAAAGIVVARSSSRGIETVEMDLS
jgi:hypothetical protein